jgi:hypothetical protein
MLAPFAIWAVGAYSMKPYSINIRYLLNSTCGNNVINTIQRGAEVAPGETRYVAFPKKTATYNGNGNYW